VFEGRGGGTMCVVVSVNLPPRLPSLLAGAVPYDNTRTPIHTHLIHIQRYLPVCVHGDRCFYKDTPKCRRKHPVREEEEKEGRKKDEEGG
jgi:hypothetical protein